MVRSRKWKATQPGAGRRESSRDSERHDDEGNGQQVRQATGSRVNQRVFNGTADMDYSSQKGGAQSMVRQCNRCF